MVSALVWKFVYFLAWICLIDKSFLFVFTVLVSTADTKYLKIVKFNLNYTWFSLNQMKLFVMTHKKIGANIFYLIILTWVNLFLILKKLFFYKI